MSVSLIPGMFYFCRRWHCGLSVVEPPGGKNLFRARMSFDRLAAHYHWMENLFAGGLMQRCRTTFLARTKDRRHALLVGEGTGKFLVELLRVKSANSNHLRRAMRGHDSTDASTFGS